MPQPFISETVIKHIETLPGYPNLKVLDLSCGEAFIITELKKEGCDVLGTHFIENDYIINETSLIKNLTIKDGVNLHEQIPLQSSAFDVVLLIEVVEHLEQYFNVVREASRLLKPGGHLIITTPNKYRLHSRLQFLINGHHKLIQRRLSFDLKANDLYANHINLVDLPLINVLLHQEGMSICRLLNTKTKWKHIYTFPFFLVNWLSQTIRIIAKKGNTDLRSVGEISNSVLLRSFNACYSEQLAIVAMKKKTS